MTIRRRDELLPKSRYQEAETGARVAMRELAVQQELHRRTKAELAGLRSKQADFWYAQSEPLSSPAEAKL